MPGQGLQLLDVRQDGLSVFGENPCQQPFFRALMFGICPGFELFVHLMLVFVLRFVSIKLLTPGFFFFRIPGCHFIKTG